jgi:hypothetical protein
MSASPTVKLLPRNVAALRKGQDPRQAAHIVAGNSVSTRLESGIGNCFPGLECDLRNLERRFFPCLEVDISDTQIQIVGVDVAAAAEFVRAGLLSKSAPAVLKRIDRGLKAGQTWHIDSLRGEFGAFGLQTLTIAELTPMVSGKHRSPPDAWTAIRMLPEGSAVSLSVRAGRAHESHRLSGSRARYLDDHGALAAAFSPGEMTQSLCSPWTHDFRDCGCFYWASNHPDIAKPPLPESASGIDWDAPVPWERADRSLSRVPRPATQADPTDIEMDHYDINQRWQELNFVLGGREQVDSYVPEKFFARPLKFPGELTQHLRYAAGVELAVIHEYLAAAFSLKDPGTLKGALRDNVTAAHAELMRLAVSEMRHLRIVNDVLRLMRGDGRFKPALQIAAELPSDAAGKWRPLAIRPADRDTINWFIDVERPSVSVDGVYSRILATLIDHGTEEQQHAISAVMAEGEDHFETFEFIREWLKPHEERDYLRGAQMQIPGKDNPSHARLQTAYRELLEDLYLGYARGFPEGAAQVNSARNLMVLPDGLRKSAAEIAARGFLVAFDPITDDSRFRAIQPP